MAIRKANPKAKAAPAATARPQGRAGPRAGRQPVCPRREGSDRRRRKCRHRRDRAAHRIGPPHGETVPGRGPLGDQRIARRKANAGEGRAEEGTGDQAIDSRRRGGAGCRITGERPRHEKGANSAPFSSRADNQARAPSPCLSRRSRSHSAAPARCGPASAYSLRLSAATFGRDTRPFT
jgi:hypothetical protein